MTVQADLVAGARLLTENATLRSQLDTAQQAARNSAHAAQISLNRLRAADNYLTTVAGVPDDIRADLRALLVGGMS